MRWDKKKNIFSEFIEDNSKDFTLPVWRAWKDIHAGSFVFNSTCWLVPWIPDLKYTPKWLAYQAIKSINWFMQEWDIFEEDEDKFVSKNYLGEFILSRVSTGREIAILEAAWFLKLKFNPED